MLSKILLDCALRIAILAFTLAKDCSPSIISKVAARIYRERWLKKIIKNNCKVDLLEFHFQLLIGDVCRHC